MIQQDEEILIMEYFREVHTDFPKGKLIKSESPDFILKYGSKKLLGIELTRLEAAADTLKENIDISLEKKSEKLNIYQHPKFDALWLIIHADFLKKDKPFNFFNKLNAWNFNAPFDQIFLFDLFDKRIFYLK